ncbi:MAG: Ca2+-binding EF-hand superfamily protein [Alphaproteobacteria bacterium]|jgi:Ca2+-binding EF-hand superfamily protein
MNTYRKTAIIGLSVIALQAITSLANVSAQESLLTTLDKDQDGLISLKEAAGHQKLIDNFNVIDVNEDGYISMDELVASDLTKG